MNAVTARPVDRRSWPTGMALIVPAVFLLAGIAVFYRSFVPDDLYIYLRFVDNLLAGAGPSFNPGEPTYGFTSVLWYGILALGSKLTGELLPAARLLSVACSLLALPAMQIFARRLSGSSSLAAGAALLLALDAWFLRWSATGMESSFGVLLLLGGFARHLREVQEDRSRVGSVVLFSLLALVRPEALALVGLALFEAVLAASGARRRQGWVRALQAVAAAALTLGPWLAYAAWRFGTLLPDTASAKAPGAFASQASASLIRTTKLTVVNVGLPMLILALACTVGLAAAWRQRFAWRQRPAWRRHRLLAAWIVGLPLLYAAAGVTAYSRYLLLWTPLVLGAGLAAGRWLLGRWGPKGRIALAGVVLLIAAQNLWASAWVLGPASQQYSRSLQDVNIGLGRWLGENSARDAVIAVENIGAIGLYSGRRILDMNGLITPELIPYKKRGQVEQYLEEHPPDYVIKIAPVEDPWSREGPDLSLELLDVRRYDKMFITQEGPLYYSLYRVVDPPPSRSTSR